MTGEMGKREERAPREKKKRAESGNVQSLLTFRRDVLICGDQRGWIQNGHRHTNPYKTKDAAIPLTVCEKVPTKQINLHRQKKSRKKTTVARPSQEKERSPQKKSPKRRAESGNTNLPSKRTAVKKGLGTITSYQAPKGKQT